MKFKPEEGTYGTIEIDGRGKLEVGKYCSLASGIKALFLDNHRIDWISTYPFNVRWNLPEILGHPVRSRGIVVGNDVWIGRDVTLLGGAVIGDGAVIGACSVIAGKIPPYSVVVGNPAKVIKKRFSDEVIEKLLKIAWWNWSTEKIMANVELICSPEVDKFLAVWA